ncbi:MAG: glycosyltransferase family 4 protein [Nanoarchaeota archaeon]|nr:glycosyltransferase family 4 protein [Nanoarchaeota archaeon]
MRKLKILELTNFSAGTCGVWQRVKQESELLSKKHELKIFSSNAVKGSNELALTNEKIGKIKIQRFPFMKLGGEGYLYWNFKKEALRFNPDVIIAHSYRLPHTVKALKIAKRINSKVFLVTHAPFIEGNMTRSFFPKFAVGFYDKFIGPRIINKFDKIITITKWEMPYLLSMGAKKEKIVYIPNGIPPEFFKQKPLKEKNKILFLGRIAPIKNIETIILAMSLIDDKKVILEIVGPAEKKYFSKLKLLVKEKKLEKRVIFSDPIYDLKNKIRRIDSSKIFILPSKREGMPQALIEAMARKKIVIASKNPGNVDLIEDGKTGYLFEVGDHIGLANKINLGLKKSIENKKIEYNAKNSVKKFNWNDVISKLEKII